MAMKQLLILILFAAACSSQDVQIVLLSKSTQERAKMAWASKLKAEEEAARVGRAWYSLLCEIERQHKIQGVKLVNDFKLAVSNQQTGFSSGIMSESPNCTSAHVPAI